ncbi:MAG: DUF1636 domain-containing protein [Alphaproteobacteria bacterium]|nr:MAG: DUF1636 domain-containing protein [Alphaproteobacteria bacterium]
MRATLIICDTCAYSVEEKTRGGQTGGQWLAALIERLVPAAPEVEIRRHSCLMGCAHSCNVALSQPGKISYVLGGFRPESAAAEAILAFARAYADSPTGQVPYRQWPQGVKGHFIARIPPLAPADGASAE